MVTEEFPNATDHNSPFADLMDKVQVHEELEISVATTNLLVERANRLAAALERLREGEYGICEECGEAISPARLRAMPEVTTCVCCQDRLERTSRQLDPGRCGCSQGPEDRESSAPPRPQRLKASTGPTGLPLTNSYPGGPALRRKTYSRQAAAGSAFAPKRPAGRW